jgi:hypothetical protein
MTGTDPNKDDHSIHPDSASAYLLSKTIPGVQIRDVRKDDGSCVTYMKIPGRGEVALVLPPGFLSNE